MGEGGAKGVFGEQLFTKTVAKEDKEAVSRLPGGEILMERRALRGG